ncbi:cysteine desulfurase [candidate division WOR-3 bacterium]|nr:cysteine desulfurase [candidate division WOR-3 bacterium]
MRTIYLDNSATTKTDPLVLSEMLPYLEELYQNPSSAYESAYKIRESIAVSRQKIADFMGCEPDEIFFTSGGTESINHSIIGTASRFGLKGGHILTSSIEHSAVFNTCKYLENFGFEVTYLPVDANCVVSAEDFEKSLRQDTVIASIMAANNETGAIQPIEELALIARKKGVIFHTDAVQAFGKVFFDLKKTPISLLSFSGHKIYAPKGIGVLYKRKNVTIDPLLHGGPHENKMRAGTENVPGIIGIAKAVELLKSEDAEERIRAMRDALFFRIKEEIPDIKINTAVGNSIYNTLNVSFKFIEGESLSTLLQLDGIEVSTGSACSSSSLEPSRVLLAMGLSHVDAHGSVRFSFGRYNSFDEIDPTVQSLKAAVSKLRLISPLKKD